MSDDIGRDCPYLRRDKNGIARVQWIREANRKCDSVNHRFRDAKHVSVAEQLAEWMDTTPWVQEVIRDGGEDRP